MLLSWRINSSPAITFGAISFQRCMTFPRRPISCCCSVEPCWAFAHCPPKDDWTKPCPVEWTWEEKKEKCISGQDKRSTEQRCWAVSRQSRWLLILDSCSSQGCTGDNLDLAKTPEDEAEVPPVEPAPAADQPSSASFASTYAYAAEISATVIYSFLSLS